MSTKTSSNFISGFQLSTRKREKDGEKEGGGTNQDIDKRKNEELDLLKKKRKE
jgi:hypothetical protein